MSHVMGSGEQSGSDLPQFLLEQSEETRGMNIGDRSRGIFNKSARPARSLFLKVILTCRCM